jgi:rare lipoprotein A
MTMICPRHNQARDTAGRAGAEFGGIGRGRLKRSLVATAVFATVGLMSSMPAFAVDQASWYGEQHRGRLMANGRPFDPDNLTAASWCYDLGTKVVVTHGDRSVVVEITDRGPAKRLFLRGRRIDLSYAAFARLADPDTGLIDVTIRKL